ncbi:MAG: nucleotidyltransferase domain-containing protein [bacterium]|nr:nucleotidyltransferase domain-containing protein [bacterium]
MYRRTKSDRVFSIVKRVKDYLSARYGQAVEHVLLYGSCARGVARESSDIDLLVVVREPLSSQQVRRELSDLLLDILLEEGELISVLVVPKTYFDASDSPFLRQVKGEAVLV